MSDPRDSKLISSKEILEKTGISRATLNNYIKMGIIPRPLVKKPGKGFKNIKSMGYFPLNVLDRLEEVKRLKREGRSMGDIAGMIGDAEGKQAPYGDGIKTLPLGVRGEGKFEKKLKLTLEDPSLSAYLLNYDFKVIWINNHAEEKILNQKVGNLEDGDSRNIFRLLFNWEFQGQVQNWKELLSYHLSFAKLKYSKTWLGRIYRGISKSELRMLERIYEEISSLPEQDVQDARLRILKKDGSLEHYIVYSIFFQEGILFLYRKASD